MAHQLLDGLRIVEIASALTEHAGRVLAELGATVYLVEPADGSPTRQRRPFMPGQYGSRRSIPFLARNANKASVVLDLEGEEDREVFRGLMAAVDATITHDRSPWVDELAAARGVVVTVADQHGIGSSALVTFAASGGLSSSGWSHQPPCNAPSWLALDAAGVYAAGLVVAGIRAMQHGNPAPRYTVPLEEAALAGLTPWTRPLYSYGMNAAGQGVDPARTGAGPYPIYPCLDGYVRVLTSTPRQWEAWLTLIGRPEALSGPEWTQGHFRAQNFDALFYIGQEQTRRRRRDDLFHEGQRLGLTITPVLSPAEFLVDPHVMSRSFFQQVLDPELGEVVLPRAPYRFSDHGLNSSSAPAPAPAPALGADTANVQRWLATASPVELPRTELTPNPPLPLAGIRVLELGVGAVVPELCSLMALLGAEVIKVESSRYVDFLRQVGIGGPGDHNGSPSFNQMNLGVLSCAVDMTTDEGRDLVRRIAVRSDVVMENMRGPVAHKWGLDYASVRERKPDIVYMSSQGLGEGTYGGFQTFGPNLQTFSGVTSVWAHPDDPYPVGSTLNHPDHLAGKQALVPILGALLRRDATGEGSYIDAAQFEMASSLIADKFLQEQLLPGTVQPLGNRSPDFSPHGVYPTVGEDAWIALAVCTDQQWVRFRQLVGEEWALDEDLLSGEARLVDADRLDTLVAAWTRRYTAPALEAVLREHAIPASRIVTGEDLAARAADHHAGLFAAVAHPTVGWRWYTGLPFVEANKKRPPVRRPPLLGEHTEYVLYDILGFDGPHVSRLMEAGVVGT